MAAGSTAGLIIGRDREIATLEAALASTREGRGSVVLVTGEPGIGKTHLADVFCARAGARGARVAWGRAWEVGGAPAYWPWVELFRSLLRGRDLAELPAARLAELAQLDPELRPQLGDFVVPAPLDPAQARFRLFDAVVALLRELGPVPLVLVLDDLHAADLASLELLQFVARSLRTASVMVVATYRDSELRARSEAADALARVSREGTTLALARLRPDDIARWLGEASSGATELRDLVFARTEGNPLFVVELLQLIDAHGSDAMHAIPDGVREVIRQRLRSVPPDTRAALDACAVLGRYIDLRVAARVLDTQAPALADGIAPAVAMRLLVPAGANRLAFSHVLIQEVLYGELATTRRAELHAAVADALIERHDQSSLLVEIVHHLFAAAPFRPVAEAIEWVRRAAAGAVDQLAYEDAQQMLERALDHVPGDAAHALVRAELLLELAAASFGAGHAADARRLTGDALALARELRAPELFARAALILGSQPVFANVDAELTAALDEALSMLSAEPSPLRARLLARLGAAHQPAKDPEPPMRLAREGVAMSRRLADPRTHLEVLHAATAALGYFADPRERIVLNQELATLASRLGDKVRALRGHLRLMSDYLEAGDPLQADACLEVCARLAQQIGRPAYSWPIPLARAMRRVMQGQFADAAALVAESRAIAAQLEDTSYQASFTLHQLGTLRAATRHVELAAALPEAAVVVRRLFDPYFVEPMIAGAQVRAGALADARDVVDRLRPHLAALGGRNSTVFLAEAAAAFDDAELAAEVAPLLVSIGSRNHTWGLMGMVCEGPIARAQALAAATAGAIEEAEVHFHDALQRVDALGAPPHRARLEVEYAAMLLRHRPSERDRALRLLDRAATTADQLGLPGLRTTIDELARDRTPAAPPARSAEPRAPRFELRPEGEYWSIHSDAGVIRLKDSRGMRILALLVASPEREFHVIDLFDAPGKVEHGGDAGEALDPTAVAAYKQRIVELREQLAEAEAWSDRGRADRARDELEHLGGELARGLGLGGRARRASSNVERARVNVRKRVLDAIVRIGEHDSALSRHLGTAVKTGTFCGYYPNGKSLLR